MTSQDRSKIERELGIIEGVLLTGELPDAIKQTLYASLTAIDEVLNKEETT